MAESEFILLRRFSMNGDAEAFVHIIRQHAPMVYGACLRILGNSEIASDVVQDTFFQLVREAAEITGSLPNWLHKVATSRAIDFLRSESQRKKRELIYTINSKNVDSEDTKAAWQEISGYIDEELENLDELTREVIILHFFEGQTMTCIGEKFGISQQTVSRRIESGIVSLRQNLKSRGVIVPAAIMTALLTENIVKAAPAFIMKELGKIAIAGSKAAIGSKITSGISAGTAAKAKIIAFAAAGLIIIGSFCMYHHNSHSTIPADNQKTEELANKSYDAVIVSDNRIYGLYDNLGYGGFYRQGMTVSITRSGFYDGINTENAIYVTPRDVNAETENSKSSDTHIGYDMTNLIAAQQPPEKPSNTWDLIRQEMTKNAEPNKPVPTVKSIQDEKPVEMSQHAELLKNADSANNRKAETYKKERILHFPQDRSIGRLYVQDESSAGKIMDFLLEDNWESFDQAKGDVTIPAGKRLYLHVYKDYLNNMSALSNIFPDDPYRLVIAGSYPDAPVQHTKPDDKIMPFIAKLTGLNDLSLSYTNISARGLSLLSNLHSLESLTITGITDEGLAEVSKLKTLKALYIKENNLTDKGLACLDGLSSLEKLEIVCSGRLTGGCLIHLAKLPSLQYLILEGANIKEDALIHLKDIPSLRILNAGVLSLTDAELKYLAKIPHLEDLSLYRSKNISDDGMAALSEITTLKKLDIGLARVTDDGLFYLRSCKNIEYLRLPGNEGITDTGLAYIGELGKLKHLDVGGNYTDKGIAELANCRLMEELSIGGSGITDESLRIVGELKNLETLSIGGAGLTDDGMSKIAKLTNLRRLYITNAPNVTNTGIAKLTTLKSLQYLSINYFTKVTVGGLSNFNELPNLISLTLLGIHQDNSKMDISGLKKLKELVITFNPGLEGKNESFSSSEDWACLAKLTELKTLQVPGYGIDDNGMKYLSGLKNLDFLNIYCIGESRITDRGIKYLTGLKKLSDLRIKDGHFTDKAMEYLSGMPALYWLELTSDFTFNAKAIKNFQAKNPNIEQLRLIP
jgi:internalin A